MAEASMTLATEGDPRKGPLFVLVDWILKAQKWTRNETARGSIFSVNKMPSD